MRPTLLSLTLLASVIIAAFAIDPGKPKCKHWEVETKRTWDQRVEKFLDIPSVVCRDTFDKNVKRR